MNPTLLGCPSPGSAGPLMGPIGYRLSLVNLPSGFGALQCFSKSTSTLRINPSPPTSPGHRASSDCNSYYRPMDVEVGAAPRFLAIRGDRVLGPPPPNLLLDSGSARHPSMGTAGFSLLASSTAPFTGFLQAPPTEWHRQHASDFPGVWEVGMEKLMCWLAQCRLEVCWATCPQRTGPLDPPLFTLQWRGMSRPSPTGKRKVPGPRELWRASVASGTLV